MNKLDLATLGVEEISDTQMLEVDGGFWGALAAGVGIYLVISSIENPESFAAGLLGR